MTSTRFSREERKNSSFRRVFWWSMGYNRIVTIFYTLFLLGGLPVGVLLSIMSNQDYYNDMSKWEGFTPQEVMSQYGEAIRQSFNVQLTTLVIPLAVLFLVVWCVRNFGYMQGRRSVDLFHALPVRRTPLFMGFYTAGLVSTLLPLAVSVGLTELLCAVNGVGGVMAHPGLFWQAALVIALPLIAAMTFTVFFMVVSGNYLNWFLMTAAVAAGWPVTVFLCDQTMSAFLPGYVSVLPGTLYVLLSPYFAPYLIIPNGFYYVFVAMDGVSYTADQSAELYNIPLEYLIWWVAFTAVMLALTLFYYGRRKSECAENPFSFPAARGAVRSLMTVGGALGLGLVLGTLLDTNLAYLIGLIVGGVVAHTVYQAVITRGFRKFWMTVPAFVVTAAIIGGGLYTLYTGGAGYVMRLPDASKLERAEFSLPDVSGDEGKECYLAVTNGGDMSLLDEHRDYEADIYPAFREQGDVESLVALHSAVLEKYPGPYLPFGKQVDYNVTQTLTANYYGKDGSVLKRSYSVPVYRDDEAILSALAQVQKREPIQYNCPFYSTTSKRVNAISLTRYTKEYEYDASNYDLTAEQREQIWNTFVEELNSPSFRNPSALLTPEESQAQQARYADEAEDEWTAVNQEPIYFINVNAIPKKELDPRTLALIEREYSGEKLITGVGSTSYTVPECCTKTRQLIDEFTEANGEYYYYNQDEEDEDEEYDQSAPGEYNDEFEDWSDVSAEGSVEYADEDGE